MSAALPERFRILRTLGQGAMGTVFEAIDATSAQRVAVKSLTRPTPETLVWFKREFRRLRELHHPSLVSLGDLIVQGGACCFSMELIDGVDFLTYVRGESEEVTSSRREDDPSTAATQPFTLGAHGYVALASKTARFDERKLRATLRQITAALIALHGAGLLHRDLKPSNVMVTREGRAVLLDFGVATDLEEAVSTDRAIAGTPIYMAPEQAASADLGPPADWYALGAMLYESLVGAPPFDGAPLEILIAKQRGEPPAPSTRASGIPGDLDELCVSLLRRDPLMRPSGQAILAKLGGTPDDASLPKLRASTARGGRFFGRDLELRRLHDVYAESNSGDGPSSIVVTGESGVGKSTLVRRFLEQLESNGETPIVLASRCYPRENVPFQALDGMVDSLVSALRRAPPELAAEVRPMRVGDLTGLFPVIGRLRDYSGIDRSVVPSSADPGERRRRALLALRELLVRLADRRRVIIRLEDTHWLDPDSLAALQLLLAPPDAPSLMLVATMRTAQADVTRQIRVAEIGDQGLGLPGRSHTLQLERLDEKSTRDLARSSLELAGVDSEQFLEDVVEESEGHPIFVDTIVNYLAHEGDASVGVKFDTALLWQLERLSPDERTIVDLLSIAPGPVRRSVIAHASKATEATLVPRLATLRGAGLVVEPDADEQSSVELAHDRLRWAALGSLSPRARKDMHRRLAEAIEAAGGSDHESLANHWQLAGDASRAIPHLLAGARNAAERVAFERAARLYQQLLALDAKPEDKRTWNVELAGVLIAGGRASEAGDALVLAAAASTTHDARVLRHRAADQLLRAGRIDEGTKLLFGVLTELGESIPADTAGTKRRVLWLQLFLFFRGLWYTARPTSTQSPERALLLAALYTAAAILTFVDPLRANFFASRGLRLALSSGDEAKIAGFLGVDAGHLHALGGRLAKRGAKRLSRATEIAARLRDARVDGQLRVIATTCAFVVGDFRGAVDAGRRTEEAFTENALGAAWELDAARMYELRALWWLGELAEVKKQRGKLLPDALARRDKFAGTVLRTGELGLVPLVDDDPGTANAERRQAMIEFSRRGVALEHCFALNTATVTSLYTGRFRDALERVDAQWPKLERAGLFRNAVTLATMLFARSRAAIALAESEPSSRATLLPRSVADAARLASLDLPYASALASLVRASASAVREGRDAPATIALASEAQLLLERAGLRLCADSIRLAVGRARKNASEASEAKRWFIDQGVANPERFAGCWAVGFGLHPDEDVALAVGRPSSGEIPVV